MEQRARRGQGNDKFGRVEANGWTYFTTRNTVILALVQVGVIVLGVLAAGAAHKWYTTFNMRLPSSTILVAEYGFLALVLPLAWSRWRY